MNEYDRLYRQAQRYREMYPEGTRILLLHMGADPRPVEDDMRGTVKYGRCAPAKELHYRNPAVSENEKRRTAAAILCGEQQPCHRQPRNLSGGAEPAALTENGKMQKKVLSADRKAALSRMRQSLPASGRKRQGTLDRLLPLVRCNRLSTPPCA